MPGQILFKKGGWQTNKKKMTVWVVAKRKNIYICATLAVFLQLMGPIAQSVRAPDS